MSHCVTAIIIIITIVIAIERLLLTGNSYNFIYLYSEFIICFVSIHVWWPFDKNVEKKSASIKAARWAYVLPFSAWQSIVICGLHYLNERIECPMMGSVCTTYNRRTRNQFSLFCFNWHFILMLIESANWIIFFFSLSLCCGFIRRRRRCSLLFLF